MFIVHVSKLIDKYANDSFIVEHVLKINLKNI